MDATEIDRHLQNVSLAALVCV